MTDFQPGDMVECVYTGCLSGHPTGKWNGDAPTKGELYTVREATVDPRGDRILLLREIERAATAVRKWGQPCGYNVARFRKVYRPKADLIAKLLAEPVLPDAPKVKKRVEASTSCEPAQRP